MLRIAAPVLLSSVLTAQVATQHGHVYERDGERWLRREAGEAYVVDPSVVTVKASGAVTVASRLMQLARRDTDLAGLAVVRRNRLGFHDVELPEGKDVLAIVSKLRASGVFSLVEENTFGRYVGGTPNDPDFDDLWHLHNTGQTGGVADADVDALEAWAIEDGDPAVTVAVLDSGTFWRHQDLAANIWRNPGELINGADSDGNGFVDDVRGWDFENDDNDPAGTFWHGTAVAGVVAAHGQNGIGIVGLAGGGSDGLGAKVMPLGVGSSFPIGSVLDDAILYAADNGAHVITLSLSVGSSSAIDAAVDVAHDDKGVFIDCAAGNNGFGVTYPANLPKIMAVASTDDDDGVSGFSNPGPEVEVAAPGGDILMCDLADGYLVNSGTSFAAPHVAALAALLLSRYPGLSNTQVRQRIIDTADDVEAPGVDDDTGAGRINAYAALTAPPSGGSGGAPPTGGGAPGDGGTVVISSMPAPLVASGLEVHLSGAPADALAILSIGAGDTVLDRVLVRTDAAGRASVVVQLPPAELAASEPFAEWRLVEPTRAPGAETRAKAEARPRLTLPAR